MQGSKGLMMEKQMCWTGLGVAGVLFIVFLLDLVTKMPFGLRLIGGGGMFLEIVILLCCGLLAYLSWDALQDHL